MDTNITNFSYPLQSTSSLQRRSKYRRGTAPRSVPIQAMNRQLSSFSEAGGVETWTSSMNTRSMQPRPVTIHDTGFSYCVPEDYASLSSWDCTSIPAPSTPQDVMNMYSAQQDYNIAHAASHLVDNNQSLQFNPPYPMVSWALDEMSTEHEAPVLDAEMQTEALESLGMLGNGQYQLDTTCSSLDFKSQHFNFDPHFDPKRISGSSFTLSTSGACSDAAYDDFSGSVPDTPSCVSDYRPTSKRNSMMSSTQLSPVASPRLTPQTRSELVRTQSRGRASPSPRSSMRSVPYSMDGARSKRWSTGSYAPLSMRRAATFMFRAQPEHSQSYHAVVPPQIPSPISTSNQHSLNMGHMLPPQQQEYQQSYAPCSDVHYNRSSMILPSHNYSEPSMCHAPPTLTSNTLFRTLQSNADSHALHTHYASLSAPPDLYGALATDPLPPPSPDMHPAEPELVPHEQELRFATDLYTPQYVRGHGNKREGWCGICKPGRWLVLKNSAFWYDKSFTHGISAATGSAFQEPLETRRMEGNAEVWEGLCGSCGEWVALVSSKKKGTTWFRHAYKCHTHPKVKDAPKRRRESGQNRCCTSTTPSMMPGTKCDIPSTPRNAEHDQMSLTPTPGRPQSRPQSRKRMLSPSEEENMI